MTQILVDTSVWIDHLRNTDDQLAALLNNQQALMHSMIRGELACGLLQHRSQLLALLKNLPHVTEVSDDEALYCLEQNGLMGRGNGFVDLHLVSATLLTPGVRLWTRDKRLSVLAKSLYIAWSPNH